MNTTTFTLGIKDSALVLKSLYEKFLKIESAATCKKSVSGYDLRRVLKFGSSSLGPHSWLAIQKRPLRPKYVCC